MISPNAIFTMLLSSTHCTLVDVSIRSNAPLALFSLYPCLVVVAACAAKSGRLTDVHHPLATKCAAFCEFFDLWRAAAGREGEAASPGREHVVYGAARSGERLTTIRC